MRLRPYLGVLVLLAFAAPLTFAFCSHAVIASLGDDSVSYLVLGRFLSPFASDPLTAPWAGHYSHFPPLFPLLLALTGCAYDFFVAHMVVAACALIALAMVCAYGTLRFSDARGGLILAVVFLLLPSAWISITGILSEPFYLAFSLAAVVFHERRMAKESMSSSVIVGLLLAAACLTRVAGIALLAAYVVRVAMAAISRRSRPSFRECLPVLIVLALQGLWIAVRPPLEGNGYQADLGSMLGHWIDEPLHVAAISWSSVSGGWISSFASDSGAPFAMHIAFAIVAILALAAAVRGAMRNRLDAWYLLASAAMLFIWVYREDNQRRLLYPLLPLMLAHAAEAFGALVDRLGANQHRLKLIAVATGIIAALAAPPTLLILEKAFDREPLIAGFDYSASSMTEYYTTVNVENARAAAWQHAAVLAGLQSLERVTPPDAKVMWMRPEYVALLGRREAVPWYFSWDRATLAREIRRTGTRYVVVTRIFKSDLAGQGGDEYAAFAIDTPAYLHASSVIANTRSGAQEFVLLEVDAELLEREAIK